MSTVNHNMILSASGWRKVFAVSGKEQDSTSEIGDTNCSLAVFAAEVFADYIKAKTSKSNPIVICGIDTRPTGPAIATAVIRALASKKITVRYTGVVAAPEIMAFAKSADGFIYISASHNPIGHNGIKFGLNDGGVLNGQENALLVKEFENLCSQPDADSRSLAIFNNWDNKAISAKIFDDSIEVKKESLAAYTDFSKSVISALAALPKQKQFFDTLKSFIKPDSIGIVCDMNGSARSLSIDAPFYKECNLNFYPFNNIPGQIVHEIIPEPENLVHVAAKMEELQKEGKRDAVLGYMPDCDGDRGNIVYWDKNNSRAQILKAQEVFSLSVLSELAYNAWINEGNSDYKPAVAVNCPTSMRIEEIAGKFAALVKRAEVGEANVVNAARETRAQGYNVRILGEGSNGGTITYPASVRDPLNTIFAFVKLLVIKDSTVNGKTKKGLYHIWCDLCNIEYKEDFDLCDVMNTLPVYTTTGVSEPRALLKIKSTDHSKLKARFQSCFERSWESDSLGLKVKYKLTKYDVVLTNGTKEVVGASDYSVSGKGGLKIRFYTDSQTPDSFIWMRGSGTEPVFRIMCDVKGSDTQKEKDLLDWETKLLLEADSLVQ